HEIAAGFKDFSSAFDACLRHTHSAHPIGRGKSNMQRLHHGAEVFAKAASHACCNGQCVACTCFIQAHKTSHRGSRAHGTQCRCRVKTQLVVAKPHCLTDADQNLGTHRERGDE